MNTNMKTKAGRLTAYALACGCVETYRIGEFSGRLVRFPATSVYSVTENGDDWRIAYQGKSLTAARKAFDNGMRAARIAAGEHA